MVEFLRVDPDALHETGAQLQRMAAQLHTDLSAVDEQISGVHAGWIGKSAQALAAKAAQWREATDTHHRNLADHSEKFIRAARMYQRMDDEAAGQVKQAVPE
jgi:WXG100 family type VII secretion target